MGEDVGKLGGVFRITDGLQKDFGEQRVIDTPLAESGIVGTAVGLAIRGYRPVCEIQFDGFVYPAYDQIVSQVAKMHYRSRGKLRLPIVIRIPFGGGIGAVEHHSESPEAYFAHTAGLKVVACSNPADAYWMIQQAIATDDPVIFFEPKRRYWEKGEVDTAAALADAYPLFASRVVRPGTDATVVAYGPMVRTALDAATAAAEEGARPRGDRPALAVAARPRPGVRLGAADRPAGRGARGGPQRRPRRRGRRPGDRGVLLLAGGAGAAGDRVRHPLPGRPGRGGVPARPGPGPRRRRPIVRVVRPMTRVKEFPLPDLGEGLTEGEILKWLVAEGDVVTLNQPIVEVETAKAAVEIPAKWAGKVTRIFHGEGETIEVGTPIIAIDTDPTAGDLPEPSAESLAAVEIAPAEGAVEPGLIGGPAPGGRTAVLVGYGPKTGAATRRPRVQLPSVVAAPAATPAPAPARARARRRRRSPASRLSGARPWPSRRCASWPATSGWTSPRWSAPGRPGRSRATTCWRAQSGAAAPAPHGGAVVRARTVSSASRSRACGS